MTTVQDIKRLMRKHLDPEGYNRDLRNRNLQALLASSAPSVAAQVGALSVLPKLTMANPEATAQGLRDLSKLDVGLLRPRVGPMNNAFYAREPDLFSRALLKLSPKEVKDWRPHGMIGLVSTSPPAGNQPQRLKGAIGSLLSSLLTPGGPKPEVIAHELGHAQNFYGGSFLKGLIAHSRMPVGTILGTGSFINLLRGATKDRSLAERDRLLNQASLLSGGAAAPVLADEFNASHNAIKLLKKLPAEQAGPILRRAYGTLGRAGSTYGMMAAAGILAPQAARWWYHRKQ